MFANQNTENSNKLKRSFALFALTSFAFLWAISSTLAVSWQASFAQTWFLYASLAHLTQLISLWRDFPKNHRPGEKELLPEFGWGSIISFIRMIAISLLWGFLFVPEAPGLMAWLPAFIFLAANFSDLFDGYLARKNDHVTILGQKLDLELDGRGILVATLLAFHYGRVPWWYLSIGLARYIFAFGLEWRKRRGRANFELKPHENRRALAGSLMGFSTAMLVPIFSPPETKLVASLFMIPFMANFIVDWWQVSGRERIYQRWTLFWTKFLGRFRPKGMFIARLLLGLMVLWRITNFPLSNAFTAIELLLALAIFFGFMARTASALLLIESGFRQLATTLGPSDWVIFILATALFFLGSGNFSHYSPEERWIGQRPGERERK